MYVRDKFPGLNETVAARLAKMISRRRQLIRYRKDHTDALQNEDATVTDKSEHNNLSSLLEVNMASEPAPSLKAPSQRTELTKATTLKINAPIATIWPTTGLYAQSVSESDLRPHPSKLQMRLWSGFRIDLGQKEDKFWRSTYVLTVRPLK
jgi:hypothetical protein